MDFKMNPNFERDLERDAAAKINSAISAAVADVAATHLGGDVEEIMARLKQAAAARGVNLTDDDWIRTNLAQPLADGQPPHVTSEQELGE